LAFLTQNKAKFWKKMIITFVFDKNAYFFAENCQKTQRIVIITSTPGHPSGDADAVDVEKRREERPTAAEAGQDGAADGEGRQGGGRQDRRRGQHQVSGLFISIFLRKIYPELMDKYFFL
jgi:hypothetical protein